MSPGRERVAGQLTTVSATGRFDLVCHPDDAGAVAAATRGWAQAREVEAAGCERLVALSDAAARHGLRFAPRGVTLLLRQLDGGRVRLDLRWYGCSTTAVSTMVADELETTIATLDTLSEDWGFGKGSRGPIHWMVVAAG